MVAERQSEVMDQLLRATAAFGEVPAEPAARTQLPRVEAAEPMR